MSGAFEGWARLELMGHRTRIGRVSEAEMYGGKLLRIDIPVDAAAIDAGAAGEFVTEFYGVTSVYALTPVSAAVVRAAVERMGDPRPVRPLDYRLEDRSGGAGDDPGSGDDDLSEEHF